MNIAMNAVAPSQVTYQTVALANTGSTPILFEVEKENYEYVFKKIFHVYNNLFI